MCWRSTTSQQLYPTDSTSNNWPSGHGRFPRSTSHTELRSRVIRSAGTNIGYKKNQIIWCPSPNTATHVVIADQYGVGNWTGIVKCSVTIKARVRDSCPHGVMGGERGGGEKPMQPELCLKNSSVYTEAGVPDRAIKPTAHR